MKDIKWHEIKTAHGNGEHLINAIENLNSKNEENRKKAYWEIDNYVVLQSDLYEASYYVIEPLVELLEQDYTVDRILPLRLLTEITLGGNGTDEVVLHDTGERKMIITACKDKLKIVKDRINRIETRTQAEKEEKEAMLENIGNVR